MFAWVPLRGMNSGFNCLLGVLGGELTLDLIVFQGFGILGFHSCCPPDLRLHGFFYRCMVQGIHRSDPNRSCLQVFHRLLTALPISSSQAWRPDPGRGPTLFDDRRCRTETKYRELATFQSEVAVGYSSPEHGQKLDQALIVFEDPRRRTETRPRSDVPIA